MRRRTEAVLGVAAVVLVLGGCDGDDGESPPTITSHPSDQTVTEGESATFTVTATGSGTLTYQWRRDGTDIPGAASASYTTTATTFADDGAQFACVVTNVGGSVESNAATLTVQPLFSDIGAGLTGVEFCSLAWGDYDNDGDLDLALAGSGISKVYRNDDGTFTAIGAGLTGVEGCSLVWGDYDSDGDLDLALAGNAGADNYISKVYRNDGGTFTAIGAGLTGVFGCSLAWGDYDNDGDLDLALAGRDAGWIPVSKIYRNDGGTFTDVGAGLTGVSSCSLAWGDYDNDGDLDLALAGVSSSGRISKVYRNDSETFTDIGAGLTGVDACSLAWGDYDNDGDLDLAQAGLGNGSNYVGKVNRNDGGTFTDIGAGLTGVFACSLAWGDYDNDGDLDLALAGFVNDSPWGSSKVYRNDDGTFTAIGAGLTGAYSGSLAWGDYDNDGDLDLALAGRYWDAGSTIGISKVYRNNGGVLNSVPSAPGPLPASAAGAAVTLNWTPAADVETPSAGLYYNLRVGTSSGGEDVFCAMADAASGLRRLPAIGNAQQRLSWTLDGLAEGTYYWSVQAVDPGFAGSPWSVEGTATVSDPAMTVKSPDGGEVWEVGSAREIKWTSGGGIANVRIDLLRNAAWETLSASVPNTGSYLWTVSGQPATDCIVRVSEAATGTPNDLSDGAFTILPFTDIGTGLSELANCSLAWGDYDSDGDLDLALAGHYWDGSDNLVSKVYRNDDGTFTAIGAGLTGVNHCSFAWGDYDNDGDLDLALAGVSSSGRISKVYRNDSETFTAIGAGLTGVSHCSLAWGDYDNDGDLDLALAGNAGTDNYISKIYRNDGGTFTAIGAGLTGVGDLFTGESSSLAWGDYDNDGDLDLALAGLSSAGSVSKVYRNDGGTFTDIGAGLTGVSGCHLAWGDYDNDGDLDLALGGLVSSGNYVGNVYRNDGGTFTDIGAGLTGAYRCSLAWGDYDNDGDLDLALAGYLSSGSYVSEVYRNEDGAFTAVGAGLTGISYGSLAWGDYDSDSDLDLALAGRITVEPGRIAKVYRNDDGAFNTPPAAPSGLSAAVSGSGPYDVTFSWSTATDAQTPSPGLTYNLRVGTTPGGDEIMPGHAITSPDARLIPAMGNVQLNVSWTLTLPAGTYYWSVQAVDTGFEGSAWAAEESVTVP